MVNDVYLFDRQTNSTTCVSVSTAGVRGDNDSDSPSVSADGRYVAFRSYATNLVTGDTNGFEDIFLRDNLLKTTTRVSRTITNAQTNGPSDSPCISADGKVIVFASEATNIVNGDTNGVRDLFAFVPATSTMTRVTQAFDGTQANGPSYAPCISQDGRYVAYSSTATNLVLGDTNFVSDVFVTDRATRQTRRVSVGSSGVQANSDSDDAAISADGSVVAFRSWASNLVPVDTNGVCDVFVHQMASGATSLVSGAAIGVEADGPSGSPALSSTGRYVAFESRAANLVSGDTNGWEDVFVRDRQAGVTVRVSVGSSGLQGDYWSLNPSMSQDGAWIAFESYASGLVPADTNGTCDVFVRGAYPTGITAGDIHSALSIDAGFRPATATDLARLNFVTTGNSAGRIDTLDAVRIARKVAGLEP
jgi:Tol biopolymer transport system component